MLFGLKLDVQQKSVATFEKRVRCASLKLQTLVADAFFWKVLKAKLVMRLRNQTMLFVEDSSTVVATESKLSGAQQVSIRELLLKIQEYVVSISAQKQKKRKYELSNTKCYYYW